MKFRVVIQWTAAAKKGLKKLPPKVQRGILNKIDELYDCDPRSVHKPLIGPLQGFYRIAYSRYRAIYQVVEEKQARGEVLIQLRVLFVAVGIRKEHDKKDVYEIARKLMALGLIPGPKSE